MIDQLKFILSSQLKSSKQARKTGGFTLIELLVAIIMAALIITPLLGFMVNILTSDRQEQAKAASEQEIKSALDYIAHDMEQAVYIYDAPGLGGIQSQIPPLQTATGCQDQAKCKPILVFWKRHYLSKTQKIDDGEVNSRKTVGYVNGGDGTVNNPGNDAFVYSLVAYYLIKGDSSDNNWSQTTSRIGRFEIRDGIRGSSTGGIPTVNRQEKDPTTNQDTTVSYVMQPSNGFMSFNLSLPGDLKTKMNAWKKHSASYTEPVQILADYIDSTELTGQDRTNLVQNTCPEGTTANPTGQTFIPAQATGNPAGFYVCVNNPNDPAKANQISAQVFIRGNALARIQNQPGTYKPDNTSPYFPTASINIKGLGFLYTK